MLTPLPAPPAAASPDTRAVDLLAAAAVLIACIPVPLLGIGHPLTHVLIVGVVATYGWLRVRPEVTISHLARGLDVWRPEQSAAWLWVAAAGIATGLIRFYLDAPVLHGRAGMGFYELLLRDHGIITAAGAARWELLAAYLPVLGAVIVLDGIFYAGLIQTRIAARTNAHVGGCWPRPCSSGCPTPTRALSPIPGTA